MKKLSFLIALVVSLAGCATNPEQKKEDKQPIPDSKSLVSKELEESRAKLKEITGTPQGPSSSVQPTVPNPVAQNTPVEMPPVNWNQFELVAIILDSNKKPVKSKGFNLNAQADIVPFDKNGMKLNVVDFNMNQGIGKVLQLSCGSTHIKQKFDSPLLLKGWAAEFTCGKTNYFVIINPKG